MFNISDKNCSVTDRNYSEIMESKATDQLAMRRKDFVKKLYTAKKIGWGASGYRTHPVFDKAINKACERAKTGWALAFYTLPWISSDI